MIIFLIDLFAVCLIGFGLYSILRDMGDKGHIKKG